MRGNDGVFIMAELKLIFTELSSKYSGDVELIHMLWEEIVNCYSTSERHYHNLSHLAYMMERAIKYNDHLTDPDTLIFSIFYHDIIYNPSRNNNEILSAGIAQERLSRLGIPAIKILKTRKQIICRSSG